MRTFSTALALCLAAGAILTSPVSAVASHTDPPPFGCAESSPDPSTNRFTACTNDVTSRTAPDAVVIDELTRLVNRTSAGDTIRISMFQWWYRTNSPDTITFDYSHLYDLTHAVIDAATVRGVDVKILIDNVSDPAFNPKLRNTGVTQPYVELTRALGSRVHTCHQDSDDGSVTFPSDCLDGGNGNAINHNKFFLFTIDGDRHVVLTSANLVPNGQRSYVNLLHVRWDGPLHSFLTDYWTRIRANDWQGWDTGADRVNLGGVVPSTGRIQTKGYVFPRAKYQDPFLNVLDDVTACPDAYNRKIWISMSGVTEARLTSNNNALKNRLTELSGMGCAVKFLIDDHVSAATRSLLTGAGAEVVRVASLHHKFLIVDAKTAGLDGAPAALRERVWTGAMNLSWSSAWRDGEAAVLLEQHEIVRAYVSHFECVWDRNKIDGGDDDSAC